MRAINVELKLTMLINRAIRGYIIFVLIIFFINTNFSVKSLSIVNNSAFQGIVNYGINFLEHMPRKIEKINDIGSQI